MEAVKDIMFLIQLLKISVKLLFKVRVDNAGAIFMAVIATTISHTKYVDISYENVNEYIKDDIVKIVFVKSTVNDSSILTKNLGAELQEKHLWKKLDVEPK